MYLPSNINTGRNTNGTPLKYTVKARDAIHQTLFNQNNNNSESSQQGQQPHILKYGSSPLLNSINASQLTINDATSINSSHSNEYQEELQPNKKKKKLFSFGSLIRQQQQQQHRSSNELHRTNTVNSFDSVPSVSSSVVTSNSAQPSMLSTQVSDSLFSRQLTHQTTNSTVITDQPVFTINLEDALPTNFKDMYSADTLVDTLPNGRPRFTQRDIIDWQLNDIRSLLIMDGLKKEWMNQIPRIQPINNFFFKIQLIPLNASDEEIIKTLVDSDIYKETNFHLNFKIKTATFIVNTVRQKHLSMLKQYYDLQNDSSHDPQLLNTPLLKYELRNVIENYLLNLGVESQCRSNFKKNCLILKKQKLQLYNLNEDFDKNKNLLKTALINNSNLFLNLPSIDKNSIKLSRDEKLKIWNQVQVEVYQKLNLDWQPDNIG